MVSLAACGGRYGCRAGRGGRALAGRDRRGRVWPGRCRWRTAPRVVALRSQAMRGAGRRRRDGVGRGCPDAGRRATDRTGWDARISVAAVNGPGSIVVSGDRRGRWTSCGQRRGRGGRARRIAVDYALALGAGRADLLEELLADARADHGLRRRWSRSSPRSTGELARHRDDGRPGTGAPTCGSRPLRDADRARWPRRGHTAFVEVSTAPRADRGVQETLDADATVVGTLRRDDGGRERC